MKKKLLRSFILVTLVIAFSMFFTACNGQTADNQTNNEQSGESPSGNISLGNSSLSSTYGNTYDFYLRIDGIEGESENSAHNKWIDVIEFSHASTQEIESDRMLNTEFKPFVFTHTIDKATPKLQKACMNGMRISSAEFQVTVASAGKQTIIYKVLLENVTVINTEVKSVKENNVTTIIEEVSLLAEKETWTVYTIKIDGATGETVVESFNQNMN